MRGEALVIAAPNFDNWHPGEDRQPQRRVRGLAQQAVRRPPFADEPCQLPSGRMEPGETPEATVAREMQEETNLTVRVERLLFDVAAETRFAHKREHTCLCTPIAGEAAPGHEPEPALAAAYSFIEVRRVRVADEAAWGSEILGNPITRRNLQLIQQALDYRQ